MLFKILGAVTVVLFLLEIVLKFGVGLGEKPLYYENSNFEYAPQPNQNVSRFHNQYITNSYGMRSAEINKKDKKRILLFGDSVLNGGSDIDQTNVLNVVLDKMIKDSISDDISVYAISAGSWGVDNAYQFLLNEIDFKVDVIGLVLSSHDYIDNMHHQKVVGVQPAWPNEKPLLATTDLIMNGILPKIYNLLGNDKYDYLKDFTNYSPTHGVDRFNEYCELNSIPFFIYFHPDISELENNDYNSKGIEFQKIINQNKVILLDGIDVANKEGYIDNIHLNESGHKKIALALFNYLKTINTLNTRSEIK